MPHKTIPLFTCGADTLYNVVPSSALLIHPEVGHDLGNLFGKGGVAFMRAQMMDTHEVPGDLEVVARDSAVLLPAPGRIGRPIFVIPLLHKGTMLKIWKVLHDHLCYENQKINVSV